MAEPQIQEHKQFLRHLQIEGLTVGYDYPKKLFYITNKGTTTYRGSIDYIFTILADVFNIELTEELQEQILECQAKVETIGFSDTLDSYSLYYTWSYDGSYIYSIQFNEWEEYPLILEAPKGILRIDNTEVVVDLTTNESIRLVIAPRLCTFYRDTLGLYIDNNQMTGICNFLIYFFNPTCINLIAPVTEDTSLDERRYSNQFKLTNYSKADTSEYIVTNNPYNTHNYTKIANIISLSNSNQITISNLQLIEDKYTIQQGTKLQITGISEEIEGEEYSANGEYTVQSIENNVITVEEAFPMDYEYPFYNCYVVLADYSIVSISRDNSTITLTEAPNDILIGDKIVVVGANYTSELETIILDKEYTVSNINGNSIVVEEEIATNFNGSDAKVYKNKLISPIKSVDTETNTLYFLNSTEYNLENNKVMCYNSNIQNIENKLYTVASMVEEDSKYIGVITEEDVDISMVDYPQLQYPVPSEDMLIEVTSTTDEVKFPTGKFILNSYTELNNYIGLCNNLLKPSDMAKTYEEDRNLYERDVEENLYNRLAKYIEIEIVIFDTLEPNYALRAGLRAIAEKQS